MIANNLLFFLNKNTFKVLLKKNLIVIISNYDRVIVTVVLLLQGIGEPDVSTMFVAVNGFGVPPTTVYVPGVFTVLVVLAPTPSVSEEVIVKLTENVWPGGGNGAGAG